jgi:hypothetical protein
MTEPNNQWIGDFHKALEERKEPRVEAPKPAEPASTSNPSQGLADWVKKMGGALTESDFRRIASTFPTRAESVSYFGQFYRISADCITRIGNGDHHKGYARLEEAVSNLLATARMNDVIARAGAGAIDWNRQWLA